MSRRERRAAREIHELRKVTETRRRRQGTIRRRRLTMLGIVVTIGALIVVGIAIAISSGSAGNTARYVPHGVGSASTITPAPATSGSGSGGGGGGGVGVGGTSVGRAPRFEPAPAATRLAAGMTLTQQVAQLFLVSIDGATSGQAASAALGANPWGGVVFEGSNSVSDAQVTALSSSVTAHLRTLGPLAPLLAASQAGGSVSAFSDLPPASQAVVGASGQPAL
ncbi:MAG: hypothetical protein ACYDHH_34385, partial [Solirubrobacteraceae bacterium]